MFVKSCTRSLLIQQIECLSRKQKFKEHDLKIIIVLNLNIDADKCIKLSILIGMTNTIYLNIFWFLINKMTFTTLCIPLVKFFAQMVNCTTVRNSILSSALKLWKRSSHLRDFGLFLSDIALLCSSHFDDGKNLNLFKSIIKREATCIDKLIDFLV